MTVMFRGFPACECLAAWLPVYEAVLLRRGVIKRNIDIAQLNGNAAKSAGTHKGGAADVWQTQREAVQVAREMGAAAWARTRAQGFDPHIHLVLNGCPHNAAARYQIDALAQGYNGLGRGGKGGKDDGPAPRQLRTWREGIEWANTRGPAIDTAIGSLAQAKGRGRRRRLIRAARLALQQIAPIRK